jgi:hypothetical protein
MVDTGAPGGMRKLTITRIGAVPALRAWTT